MMQTAKDQLDIHIAKIIEKGGIAEQNGFLLSPQQIDYAGRWSQTIARSNQRGAKGDGRPSVSLLGADTGTGKTIAFGIPSLVYAGLGARVGIATHTHALQRQYLGTADAPGDLERIADWVEASGLSRPRIARRVGKQAFISASAVHELILHVKSKGNTNSFDMDALDDMLEFALEANNGKTSGLIDELKEAFGGQLPKGVNAASVCLMGKASTKDNFAYDTHLDVVNNAQVVLFSHAYLLSCAMFRKSKYLEGPIDALVIDEADTLENQASEAFKFDVSLLRVKRSLDALSGEQAKEASDALTALVGVCFDQFDGRQAMAVQELSSRCQDDIVLHASQAAASLGRLAARMEKSRTLLQDDVAILQDTAEVLNRFIETAAKGSSNSGSAFAAALSYSPSRNYPSLSIMPVQPGLLVARIWNYFETSDGDPCRPVAAVLLTSATFSSGSEVNRSIDAVPFRASASGIGVWTKDNKSHVAETDLWASFEPSSFGAVRYVLADPNLCAPVESFDDDGTYLHERWVAYAGKMIVAAKTAGGRTLVLVPSYTDAAKFGALLQGLGVTCLLQRRGQSMADLRERFLAEPNSVWISPTAWAGLNLPGAIANLVVPRLPFKAVDQTMKALMRSQGRLTNHAVDSILSSKSMASAKAQFRQGLGRPIRTASDKARIWIADPRFPLHPKSAIPGTYADQIRFSGVKRYAALHRSVPKRFDKALEFADVMLEFGEILKAKTAKSFDLSKA